MSYLVYLNHYNIRQCKAQYLSVLYEVLGKNLDSVFILNKDYLQSYKSGERWEVRWAESNWCPYSEIQRRLQRSKHYVADYPENMVPSYYSKNMKDLLPSQILDSVVNLEFPEQIKFVEKVLQENSVRAGVTWVNNKCFRDTLEKHGKKVFHHEMGPLRPNLYIPTIYLDFQGVNGGTEFDKRFEQFLKIADTVPILDRKDLLKVVSPQHYEELYKVLGNRNKEYEIGVGLQVEVDTNLLIFNRGVNWVDPILKAEVDSKGKVLVRQHPSAGFSLTPIDSRIVVNDLKRDKSHDFINRCDKIYCLNSSIGFEAMLLGREAKIFGDSPFRSICDFDEDLKLKALNFSIFGYLIHRELLFSKKYYEYRLFNIGNEREIYLDNMKRLIKKAGIR